MKSLEGRLAIACLALAATGLVAAPRADAAGVTLIQLSNGKVQTYSDVHMALAGETITLRTADGKGTLRVAMGACSFDKNIERCLPYSAMLTQNGKTHKITLAYGTVFLNVTNEAHRLSLSSDELAPHTILVLLKTAHGTYVTAKGTLDEARK